MDSIPLKPASLVRLNRHKCLMNNWFDERRVREMEDANILPKTTEINWHGHPGLLTVDRDAQCGRVSTFRDHYVPLCVPQRTGLGLRRKILEDRLLKEALEKKMDEMTIKPEPMDYRSATHAAYNTDFESKMPEPTKVHNFRTDQAMTYWSEKGTKVPGVTHIHSKDAMFHKNAIFSTPVELAMRDKHD